MVCPLFGNQLFFLTGRSFLAFPIGKIHFSCVTPCSLPVFTYDFQIDLISVAVNTSTAWNKNCEKDPWRARNDFNTTHSAQPDTVQTRGISQAHGTECFQFARGVDYSRVFEFPTPDVNISAVFQRTTKQYHLLWILSKSQQEESHHIRW